MKKLILTTLAFSLLLTAFAAPKRFKLLSSTSNWDNTANWSPAGLPKDGDTIQISENVQLTLSKDLTLKNIYLDLYGSLILSGNNMKMMLENNATLNVHTSGWIDGSKASQQIVMGNTILFKGNQPIITGPKIATNTSKGFAPYIEHTILPVKFISFNVARSNNSFLVQWTTTDEKGAAFYEVERSNDAANWKKIATLHVAGNTINNYSFTDKESSANTVYYRIKQIDTDGAYTYTAVRMLKNDATTMPSITAAQNKITVFFPQPVKGKVTIEVINLNGYVMTKQTVTEPSGNLQLTTLALRGVYVIRVSNGQQLITAKQIFL